MELISVINNIYALPVAIVVICAILVFAVGFKAESEPNLRHLTLLKSKPSDDKKKKKKKEVKVHSTVVKPQTNGAVKPKESPKKETRSVVRDPEPVQKIEKSEKKVKKQEKKAAAAAEADSNAGEWEVVTPKARKAKKEDVIEEVPSQTTAVVAPVVEPKVIKEDSWAEQVERSPQVTRTVERSPQVTRTVQPDTHSVPVPATHEPQQTSEESSEESDVEGGSTEFTWADVMKHKKGKKPRNVVTTPQYEENSQMYDVDVEAFPSIEVSQDAVSEDKTSEVSEKISELSSDIEIIHHDDVTFHDQDTIAEDHDEVAVLNDSVED